ncbi:hypothetical protein AYO20_10471 [Fonsecaea nubica]|uniref:Uncharacterized protein n=1 Tax=Fonsecaea nubica TaxID=856822 RepID=A0A178C774_9EURO|nr:hypothetical protein AYO20_10471 [Fonsecaea nubica]OAL25437.1 hypothetical protein AYO20_10471 [Fonsecaea nubica]
MRQKIPWSQARTLSPRRRAEFWNCGNLFMQRQNAHLRFSLDPRAMHKLQPDHRPGYTGRPLPLAFHQVRPPAQTNLTRVLSGSGFGYAVEIRLQSSKGPAHDNTLSCAVQDTAPEHAAGSLSRHSFCEIAIPANRPAWEAPLRDLAVEHHVSRISSEMEGGLRQWRWREFPSLDTESRHLANTGCRLFSYHVAAQASIVPDSDHVRLLLRRSLAVKMRDTSSNIEVTPQPKSLTSYWQWQWRIPLAASLEWVKIPWHE